MSGLQGRLQLAIYQGLKEGEQSIELVERILPLIHAGIAWRPIAELPDELKDGREVLLALESGFTVAWWSEALEHWTDIGDIGLGGLEGTEPTHFAEITPP